MKWSEALKDFEIYLKLERGLSEHSISAYLNDVHHLRDIHSTRSPIDIKFEDLRDFIMQLANVGLEVRSQARIISGIKSFFNFLIYTDLISSSPAELLETPKIGRKIPNTLSVEEIDLMITHIDRSTLEGERNRVILETLYGCGLRVSELINLKLSDLFFDEGFIKVTGKGNKQRFVPINLYNMKCIKFYIEEIRSQINTQKNYEDILFLNRRGKQLTRVMIFIIIRDLAKKAQIHKTISPHTFRHSFATDLLSGGADLSDIQKMLGHESIITTEIYMHLDKSSLRRTLEKYHPRANHTN